MKDLLILIAILGIIFISGSVFYYYVIFLPEQESQNQDDIEAIRNVIAPPPLTQQQQKAQIEAQTKSEADAYKSMEAWNICQKDILDKQEAEVNAKCKFDGTKFLEWQKCSSEVRRTSQYQGENCGSMF